MLSSPRPQPPRLRSRPRSKLSNSLPLALNTLIWLTRGLGRGAKATRTHIVLIQARTTCLRKGHQDDRAPERELHSSLPDVITNNCDEAVVQTDCICARWGLVLTLLTLASATMVIAWGEGELHKIIVLSFSQPKVCVLAS